MMLCSVCDELLSYEYIWAVAHDDAVAEEGEVVGAKGEHFGSSFDVLL